MREMTDAEIRSFLSHGTRTGALAVVMEHGHPHVTPIWFVLDGDHVVFTTWATSVKGRALRRDRRVSMTVDDQAPPYAYVHLRGRAEISEDLEALLQFATLIGSRYMGAERADEFGRRNAVPGEVLVRIRPDRVVGQAEMAV